MNSRPDFDFDGAARYLFWVAGLTGAVALALAPLSFHVERRLDTRCAWRKRVGLCCPTATRFRSPFVDRVVLVIQGLPPADSYWRKRRH